MNEEDLERYETEVELQIYKEYRDVLPLFKYVVETERRFYLANTVDLETRQVGDAVYFEIQLKDAWVWDMYRPARFLQNVRIMSFRDVNIEELEPGTALASRRIARFGESLATAYLAEQGSTIVGRNVRAGPGEIDLLVRLDSTLVAVEVKTRLGADPRPAYTVEKSEHVWETVRRLRPRPQRVDLVAIELSAEGAAIRWIPGVR